MSFAETLLPEFDQEMASTRKVLERIPDDKLEWKAHPSSNTIGWNANHVADIPNWIVLALTQPSLDIAPMDGPKYVFPSLTSRQAILGLFDRNVAEARRAIAEVKDERLGDLWEVSQAGQVFLSMPRFSVVRVFALNHLIHHRAHLCVYLRLNDVEEAARRAKRLGDSLFVPPMDIPGIGRFRGVESPEGVRFYAIQYLPQTGA